MNIPLLITDDKNNTVFAIYEDGTVEFTTAKGVKKKCSTSKDIALALAGALKTALEINAYTQSLNDTYERILDKYQQD